MRNTQDILRVEKETADIYWNHNPCILHTSSLAYLGLLAFPEPNSKRRRNLLTARPNRDEIMSANMQNCLLLQSLELCNILFPDFAS